MPIEKDYYTDEYYVGEPAEIFKIADAYVHAEQRIQREKEQAAREEINARKAEKAEKKKKKKETKRAKVEEVVEEDEEDDDNYSYRYGQEFEEEYEPDYDLDQVKADMIDMLFEMDELKVKIRGWIRSGHRRKAKEASKRYRKLAKTLKFLQDEMGVSVTELQKETKRKRFFHRMKTRVVQTGKRVKKFFRNHKEEIINGLFVVVGLIGTLCFHKLPIPKPV